MRMWFPWLLSALLLLLVGCKPVFEAKHRARLAEDVNNVRQVLLFIQSHSMDHDEKLPPSLQTLVDDANLEPALLEVGDGKGNTVKLHYIPGHTLKDPGDTIILHGPARADGKRVAGCLDGSARVLREAEFQAQLQEKAE